MASPIPTNSASFSVEEILRATGGTVVEAGSASLVTSVSTDTRTLRAGAVFVALPGDNHDGHDHLEAAARAGSALAIVERECRVPPGMGAIRVSSSLRALGDLARAHVRRKRSQGTYPIVGITGSAGKTTTRIALSALLQAVWGKDVHSTAFNLNNRVGVPLVLLGIEAHHRATVVEMGTNLPGEIAELCRIAEPTIGVLTLIARAHTEGLGGIDGVAAEKGTLFRALPDTGVAIGNGDDALVRRELTSARSTRKHLYGRAEDADVRILGREPVGLLSSRLALGLPDGRSLTMNVPLLGEAGALACSAAIGVVELALGVQISAALAELAFSKADVGGGAGRLVPRLSSSGLAVIDDSYNANPASMAASIRAAAEIARTSERRLVLVLGEMKELGVDAAAAHEEVAKIAVESGADLVVAVGGHEAHRLAACAERSGAVHAVYARDADESSQFAMRAVQTTDLVLVKGSRSIRLERVVRTLVGDEPAREGSCS